VSRPFSEIRTGVGLLISGFRIVVRTPRLLLIGALPAILTTVLLLSGLITLIVFVDELAAFLTPFADSWSEGWQTLLRVALGVGMLAGAIFVSVLLFAVLTLTIGGPFYEKIAAHVDTSMDASEGRTPAVVPEPKWWEEASASIRVLARSVLYALGLLGFGLIPLVGQSMVPVVSACVAGWLIAVELVGVAFSRRGLGLDERRRALRSRRLLTLSFGVPAYLLCLVPLLAIVVMPAAVAGGTLLAREVLRTSTSR
jgi:CysZ protein